MKRWVIKLSWESYEKAKKTIFGNHELADFIGGRDDHLIRLAEERLGLTFSKLYRDFLRTFGAGNFGSQEIFGIIDSDFEHSTVPDAIWYTLSERKQSNLPNHLLVIYHVGNGELFCLDYHQLENEEPKVVTFIPGVPVHEQSYEIIAEDFGDFLYDLVQLEISE